MLNICIIGKGSIGQLHAKIYKKLGNNVFFLRSSIKKQKKIEKNNFTELYSYEDLKKIDFSLYLICNPTSLHFSTLKKILKKGVNIFVEKPLTSNLQDLNKIKKYYNDYKINLFIGYMLRYDPRIILLKSKIKNQLPKVRYANFFVQTFMPGWHPWENYRKSYASNKKLGGGALLTCSHEIDLSVFLFGKAQEVFCTYTKSFLKTDVENSLILVIKHKNGITSNIILDFSSKVEKKRNFQIYLDKSSYYWDFYKPSILININGRKSFGIPFKSSSISKIYNYQNETILKNIVKKFKRKNFIDLSHTEKIIFAAKKSYNLKKMINI